MQKGFTLIEMMIAIGMVMILGAAVAGAVFGTSAQNTISYGVNGMTEIRCIDGYRFVIDQHGQARQVLDEFGKGSRCENPNLGKPGSFGRY